MCTPIEIIAPLSGVEIIGRNHPNAFASLRDDHSQHAASIGLAVVNETALAL